MKKGTYRWLFLLIVFSFLLVTAGPGTAQDETDHFTLTVMHTNDTHAAHEADSDGNGGVARMATVVKQIRDEVDHSLLVDGGDRFTGSVYHSFYQGWDSAQVMTRMGYDAMVLGSYEFTHGADRLADFVNILDFPVVVANVDFSQSPRLAGQIEPYMVFEMDGQQVGVLGLTQGDSRIRPIPELVFSTEYVDIAQEVIDTLAEEGVNKIVLLSHLGYFEDLELATQLNGVDIIVGGDSNTLLSNTLPNAEGPYPAVATSASGEPVLVIQAGERNQVLGRLDATFDAEGVLVEWGGDAIPITGGIDPDPQMQQFIDRLRASIEATFFSGVVGQAGVHLEGAEEVCRFEECNLGNLITDAMRETTDAQIAFHNGGGIRASIDPGPITAREVFEVLPFNNTFVLFDVTGADIVAALENSVSRVQSEEGTGRFLQVSGLRYSWDGSQPVGRRIVEVEVLNVDGEYELLDPDAVYTVATNDYLFAGGDDYTMFAENGKNSFDFGRTIEEVVRSYISNHSPIDIPPTEGRINRLDR